MTPTSTAKSAKNPRLRLKRGEQKEARTQELLDAAWELFCELGYDPITIDQVAEAAGYSRKPVYTLFGDKQSLFFELWARLFLEIVTMTTALFEPGATLRANLKRLADLGAERARQNATQKGSGLFFVVQTIALGRDDLAARITQMHRDVIRLLEQAIVHSRLEKGENLRGKPEDIAANLIAHINGLVLLQFQTGKNYMRAQDLFELFLFLSMSDRQGR